MPVTIRSRLLLLMLSALLPGVLGALWVIASTVQVERQANERTMRDTARALSQVVERELTQRATLARLLSMSRALDAAPEIAPARLAVFEQQARRAMVGLGGWVELSDETRVLLDTRRPEGIDAPVPQSEPQPLFAGPTFGALQQASDGTHYAAIVMPVERGGRSLLNLTVTLLPSELQRIIDEQRLPANRIATVVDSRGAVVARYPGGAEYAGRLATADLRAHLAAGDEGAFESLTLDGVRAVGYFKTSTQGWSFVSAMKRPPYTGGLPTPVIEVTGGALVLLALALVGAAWMSRRIVAAVVSLKDAALRVQAGQPVAPRPTGIVECDDVAGALAQASVSIHHARADLERQIGQAVERTRAAEQRVAQSQRVEALGRLTGGVAHDFNNLLGVISNSTHLVMRHATGPEVQAPLGATLRAVEVGSRLTQHLLRIAGRRPVRPQRIFLTRWLPELQELMASVLGKRIELSVSVEPDTAPLTIDAGELELALVNLCLNGRDALPSGGHFWLHACNAEAEDVADLPPGPYVVIAVSDDGSGLDAELAEHVFEPFFTTKTVGKGTGLGLSQVHGFCVQARGTARLGSTRGLGTTVTLVLPASPAEPDAPLPPPAEPAAATAGGHLAGVRVLLVEDNAELADVTGALLRSYGCEVEPAASADEALQLHAQRQDLDIVLSDIVMPGTLDGVALARRLRAERPALPVLLMSGYSTALASARDFVVLQKPYTQDALLLALQAALQPPGTPGSGR